MSLARPTISPMDCIVRLSMQSKEACMAGVPACMLVHLSRLSWLTIR